LDPVTPRSSIDRCHFRQTVQQCRDIESQSGPVDRAGGTEGFSRQADHDIQLCQGPGSSAKGFADDSLDEVAMDRGLQEFFRNHDADSGDAGLLDTRVGYRGATGLLPKMQGEETPALNRPPLEDAFEFSCG
jgi:hypothetical protein